MKYLQDIYFSNLNAVYNFGGYFSISETDDWSFGRNRFEQCKFYFITCGSCVIEIERKKYHGKAGDWFFIPSGAEHAYYNEKNEPFKKYWMHFDLYPSIDIFNVLNLPYVVQADNKGNALRLFKKYAKLRGSDKLTDKLEVKACLVNLLAEYIKAATPEGVDVIDRKEARLNDLLRFINENLDKPLSNEMLAERYFAHPNHFIRAFKEKTGLTPAKYIKAKRMENAKRLLESTDLSILEITEKIGLVESTHFSKLFKEYYNFSPTQYRRNFHKEMGK
ncbi:MAG: helix-turn-helix transcriptional regulator [Clostridia bacterium]|nr:helix-turn-helix transcriptional regulator [Clostridia bacterium]